MEPQNASPHQDDNKSSLVIFVLIGVVVVFITLIVHEFGHALTALIVGGKVTAMRLWGDSIYPEFGYIGFKGGYIGYTNWVVPAFTPVKNAIILVMGSGTTLIISIFSIVLLYFLKPVSFFSKTTLFFFSLLYLDMVTYTFGLRFSGSREPLEAAQTLGISESSWMLSMGILFLIFSALIALYFFRSAR